MKIVRCDNGHFFDEDRFECCPHCSHHAEFNETDIPSKFRELGLISKIATGSVSKVYKIAGKETYALKVIDCGTDMIKYSHALREMAMMQRLTGMPHVVQMCDSEIVDVEGRIIVYILEEYHTSLSEYISNHSITVVEVIKIVSGICDALVECKKAGVVHLDVQPKNIFIDDIDSVRIGDFSSSLWQDELKTNTNRRGTLAYMAPEVYREGWCSERADIYSLGLVLYGLFHNKILPFMDTDDENLAIYKRLAGTPFPEICCSDSIVNSQIMQLIRDICEFEPQKRIQSAEEIKNRLVALFHYLEGTLSGTSTVLGGNMRGILTDAITFDADEIGYTTALCGEQSPTSTIPHVDMKKVQFSAVAPKSFIKGEYAMIDIFMYEEHFRHVVDELIKEAEEPVKETKSGMFKVAENSKIRICLTSPDIDIEDNEEVQEWQGDYLNFSFAVMLPEQYKKRQILFQANVYINDMITTKLKFVAKCFSLREQKISVSREDVLSAFVSYASQDRQRVATIIQGMKKVCPDMDIFFDVDSLRSGEEWEKALHDEIEKRDILFLCWSRFASQSKWVDAEWRYALENKGIECIEPIPMEPPNVCPPPTELQQKHFNDKLLYIIQAEDKVL